MSLPTLTVDADGRVVGANAAAVALLGTCAGRRCSDVVRARDTSDLAVCNAHCAPRMVGMRGGDKDRPGVRVRSETRRLVCSAVGNQGVVTLLPDVDRGGAVAVLSPREREVLELVADGLTAREIGRRLGIRPSTARTHVEKVREKLGARTRAEAVARAMSSGELA